MTINHAYNYMNRKLTGAARDDLCQALEGQPGIPPAVHRIARKEPQLLAYTADDLWGHITYTRYKADWQQICAILPTYLPDGVNGTIVYFADGDCEVLQHRITWVLDDLLEHLCTSKELLHRQSIRWMGGINRRRVPLVVSDAFCLVPVNTRIAQRRNDGTTGYVVLEYIDQVLPGSRWRSCHRDGEDLLSDYDNVLNHPQLLDEEISMLILKPMNDLSDVAKPFRMRDAYKLALRDSHITVQNNIYLAYQLLGVRAHISGEVNV